MTPEQPLARVSSEVTRQTLCRDIDPWVTRGALQAGMKHYRVRRSVFILIASLVAMLGGASPVSAHAIVTRTDPADGAVLSSAPKQIRLWFTEAVALNFTTVELIDSSGQSITPQSVHAEGNDASIIVIELPKLKPSAYRLSWRALASDDLHITNGTIVFGVQQAVDQAPASAAANAPPPFEVGARWLDFIALAALIGALALMIMVEGDSLRRLLRLALIAGGASLITGIGELIVQSTAIGGTLTGLITQTSYGARWLMREGWLVALIGLLIWQSRPSLSKRVMLMIAAPLVIALVLMQALNSHATAFNDDSAVRVIVDALHLLAASVWVGGLMALTITIVPLLRRGPNEKTAARSVLRRFGVFATASLGTLLVTGLYNSGQQVASLDAWLFTLYGQSLLLKIGLALIAGFIGLINSSLLHPRVADRLRRVLRRPAGWTPLRPEQLWRTVPLEAIGAISILLIVAVLTSTQPARGPEFDPPRDDAAPRTLSANAADLFVTLSIKPNRPGQNFVLVGVFDTRRPAPAPIERVTVRLTPPGGEAPVELTANPIGSGKYQIVGNTISDAGDWQVALVVKRPGLPDARWSTPWNVLPASALASRPVVISSQPLAPILTAAAILVALILIGVTIAIRQMQRAAPQPIDPLSHRLDLKR